MFPGALLSMASVSAFLQRLKNPRAISVGTSGPLRGKLRGRPPRPPNQKSQHEVTLALEQKSMSQYKAGALQDKACHLCYVPVTT